MRHTLIALLVFAFAALPAAADALNADVTATGTVVLWFFGQDVTAEVHADVVVSGSLDVGNTRLLFSASGPAIGSGTGNMDTLAVDAVLTFRATGTANSGEVCSVEGGIYFAETIVGATPSPAGEGRGRFFVVVTTPSGQWLVEGEGAGGASGDFSVPDDPATMQLAGTATLALTGSPALWTSQDGAPFSDWPAEIARELARLWAELAAPPAK